MKSYKRLISCIFIKDGKAVRWFDDETVISEDVVALAETFDANGADELIVFDLSKTDEEHDETIDYMKRIARNIHIPMIAAGNIKRSEDVKKFLYAGARRAMLNFSKESSVDLIADVCSRFGKDKIAVSLNEFDQLFKHKALINDNCSEIVFMHRLDLGSVRETIDQPVVVLTDTQNEDELLPILKAEEVNGLAGKYLSNPNTDLRAFKEKCEAFGIQLIRFASQMEFSQFKLNSDGMIPVVVQDHRTNEVLMVAYMDEKAYYHTLKTGRMTYYSRSRKEQWVKGETSGHYQYVKSLIVDCDNDTLLAKVEQIGAACHTGNRTCFFQPVAGIDSDELNPLRIFQSVYDTIEDRKLHPKEGSYTNYLFDKGLDKILKKVGEEATELVIAAKNPNPEEIKYELSDFLYHAMVLMVERGVTWDDIIAELANR
jgi:phosphoribosyl-ATP pyrophosphohydrolase/phosphoribosyl-AMP cyclohydrolase